jgi:hypothetical protein
VRIWYQQEIATGTRFIMQAVRSMKQLSQHIGLRLGRGHRTTAPFENINNARLGIALQISSVALF